MTVRIKPWHGIVIVVFLALVLIGMIIAALQASAEAKAEGPELVAVARATATPEPTQGWWITVTVHWDDWEATPVLTSTEGCSFGSQYVADVTIPDGKQINAGEGFTKTWEVRNTGSCDWHAGYELVYVSGEQMSDLEIVSLPAVAAGEEGDVSVDLVAPSVPGSYSGTWRIRPQGGEPFGTNLTVVIEVPPEGAVVPTVVPVGISFLSGIPGVTGDFPLR
jgi:hypothetical protein